ncbi:MAG: F0F1 ATP synthase subunit [Syntrophus sp. (in: bacteria)]|nr:F0F1 ATP synthase subunit [Syntrophus sp. (in: bacteria)]
MDSDNRKSFVQMAYAGSVGFAFVLLIFCGLFVGAWLDRKMGTSFLFTILLFVAGVAAGLRNLHVLIKRFSRDDETIITSIRSEPHRQRPQPAKE